MKKLWTVFAVVLNLVAAPVRAAAPLKVVTTIETLGDLARRVGGDRVQVQSLSHGYNDPHFVEGKPHAEVAAALGITALNARVRACRIKKELTAKLSPSSQGGQS